MKLFILKISAFLIIIVVVLTCLLVFIPDNKAAYLYEHRIKMERLDTLKSPRLILVGGSNVAFGLNSKEIQDSLGLNVQNTALHAGNGLKFTLEEVLKRTRKGDIVVIMPEYEQFFGQYTGDVNTLPSTVLYSKYNVWESLSPNQILDVISGIPYFIKLNLLSYKSNKNLSWNYQSTNFNEYGDEEAHWYVDAPNQIADPPTISKQFDEDALSDIVHKMAILKKKGCEIIWFWPINSYNPYMANKKAISLINENLNKVGIEFSVSPDFFVQPDSLHFDGSYHMGGKAVQIGTERFILAMKKLGY